MSKDAASSSLLPSDSLPEAVLPFAYGRSYGDSCLNHGAALLDVAGLDRLIAFDDDEGVLRSEAGVTLAQIIAFSLPRGWFPPIVPGTGWVSVGGAIANDIHGKNHHRAGTFGAHVVKFELLRSNGERLICSPPAKDARVSRQSFRRFFPGLVEFAGYVDPRFSSSFWRRVHAA
jgi:FAD/FMN-containing dehydrogenase